MDGAMTGADRAADPSGFFFDAIDGQGIAVAVGINTDAGVIGDEVLARDTRPWPTE